MIFESVIYEEEIESYENEIALARALNDSYLLINMLYYENTNDESKSEKIKNMIDRIIKSFKVFIIKCKDYLKSAIKKLIGRISDAYTEYKLKDMISKFDSSIAKAEKAGMKSFNFIDIKAMFNCLNDECNMYEKTIKKFTKEYIKHASPNSAEKMLNKFNEISVTYDTKLKDIFNNTKEYSINEAKDIVSMIEKCKSVKNGGYTDIVDRYMTVCDEVETLTINTLNSLNKYSEDTGYIQNAKTLQKMIHNSCIKLQVHSAECITAILKTAIPLICKIDSIAHTKFEDTGKVNDDGLKIYEKNDTSSDKHKEIRNTVSNVSEFIGTSSDIGLKSLRKVTRKNDIKDWKFTKGESPLSFDRRHITNDEIKKAAINIVPQAAIYGLNTYSNLSKDKSKK